jgi:hypothetical protein
VECTRALRAREIVGGEEAHVVAGHHRQAALAGGHQRELVEGFLALAAGAGQLQVQAIAEHALPVGQLLLGQFMLAVQRQAPGQALPPGQREQVGVAGLQPVRVDATPPSGRWPSIQARVSSRDRLR